MKIVYIPPKNKKKEIRLYSSTTTALLSYLPLASYSSALSNFIVFIAIVFSAYMVYILFNINKLPCNKTMSINIQDNKDCTITIHATN